MRVGVAISIALAVPSVATAACDPFILTDPKDTSAPPANPILTERDCVRLEEIEQLAARLQDLAGIKLNPMAVKMKERVSATYNLKGRRLAVTVGALRQASTPDVLSGFLAHEICHVLQWDAHKSFDYLKDANWKQMESQADALALLLLQKAGLGQAALRASQEAAWSCPTIQADKGDEDAPAYWVRWSNAALLRERIATLATHQGALLDAIPLEAFDKEGRVRGSFLTHDRTLAAQLDGEGYRRSLVAAGCGVRDWESKPVPWPADGRIK